MLVMLHVKQQVKVSMLRLQLLRGIMVMKIIPFMMTTRNLLLKRKQHQKLKQNPRLSQRSLRLERRLRSRCLKRRQSNLLRNQRRRVFIVNLRIPFRKVSKGIKQLLVNSRRDMLLHVPKVKYQRNVLKNLPKVLNLG